MNRLLIATVIATALQACAVTGQPPTPIRPPIPAPILPPPAPQPRPYDGHVTHIASWLPNAGADGSASFTNTMMLAMDCGDPVAAAAALRVRANSDGRAIILHSGLMGWGNEGYQVIDAIADCWPLERAFIADYRPRLVSVHTADEPWDVAWSYWQHGVYMPNRYNADIARICAMVHGDFPDLPCAVNVGSVPAALQIPAGVNEVWIESYDADWRVQPDAIAGRNSATLALMPPGFVAGDPAVLDAQKAALVQAEWIEAQANPRVQLLVWFLWCCDDTVTGDRNFYSVSGGRLPQTLAALVDVGQQMRTAR